MITFKESRTIGGKFKDIKIVNNEFVDEETGEVVDVAAILGTVYGNEPFDLATSQKTDTDVTPTEE